MVGIAGNSRLKLAMSFSRSVSSLRAGAKLTGQAQTSGPRPPCLRIQRSPRESPKAPGSRLHRRRVGGTHEGIIEITSTLKPSQHINGCVRFGPDRVIEIHISSTNDSMLINYKTRGHWQRPGIITVECRQIKFKYFTVDPAHPVRQSKGHSVFLCHLIASVT